MFKLPLWNNIHTVFPMLILSSQLDYVSHEVLAMGVLRYISAEGASEKMQSGWVRKKEQKRVCQDGWSAKIFVKHLNKKMIITCSHLWLQRIGWWSPLEEKLTCKYRHFTYTDKYHQIPRNRLIINQWDDCCKQLSRVWELCLKIKAGIQNRIPALTMYQLPTQMIRSTQEDYGSNVPVATFRSKPKSPWARKTWVGHTNLLQAERSPQNLDSTEQISKLTEILMADSYWEEVVD